MCIFANSKASTKYTCINCRKSVCNRQESSYPAPEETKVGKHIRVCQYAVPVMTKGNRVNRKSVHRFQQAQGHPNSQPPQTTASGTAAETLEKAGKTREIRKQDVKSRRQTEVPHIKRKS